MDFAIMMFGFVPVVCLVIDIILYSRLKGSSLQSIKKEHRDDRRTNSRIQPR